MEKTKSTPSCQATQNGKSNSLVIETGEVELKKKKLSKCSRLKGLVLSCNLGNKISCLETGWMGLVQEYDSLIG